MATSLQKRVKKLEGDGAGECPECGWGGGDDFGPRDTYEVVWVDPSGPEEKEEWCETCGRHLVIVLTWGDGAL